MRVKASPKWKQCWEQLALEAVEILEVNYCNSATFKGAITGSNGGSPKGVWMAPSEALLTSLQELPLRRSVPTRGAACR